jgi:FMN phosphatase YigB (HAD superfamily)
VLPGQAAFVDESPANVEAARALGMRGVLFRDPPQALDELKRYLA